MAAALSMSFTACIRNLDSNNAEEVANLLGQKYGIEFGVKSIGNRLASDKADTVTAYCYPKNNEKVIFEAVMNAEHKLVADDYLVRVLEVEAKEIIENKFTENGIKATALVSVFHLSSLVSLVDTELANVIRECPDLSLTFATVLCEDADREKTYSIIVALLVGFYSNNRKMLLGTTIWKYPEKVYNDCAKEINSLLHISKTVLEQYNPISKVNVAIVDGVLNKSFEEFAKEF